MALYVNWQELEVKASELEGYKNSLKSECDLYEQNGMALRNSFEGDAAEDFFKEVTDHKTKMGLFIELIEKYVAAMRQMADAAKKAANSAQATVAPKNY